MKKIFNLLSTAIVAIAFSACSDVPAPYELNNGPVGSDGSTYISETFSSGFGSFKVKTVKGIDWVIDYSTAKASGYDNNTKTNTESESYLVSKTIDLSQSTGAYIEFEYILRYASNGINMVYITDSYTDDPTTTEWTDITGKLIEGSDWNTFSTYSMNIPEKYIGKAAVNIAFYYYASSNNSATWEVKNLKVKEGTPDDNNGGEEQEPAGGGTRENPFNVATAISAAQGQTGWVKGYIVGWVDGQTYESGAKFSIPTEAQTEILLADTPDETTPANCIPVQLPAGDIRIALELYNNQGLYKKEVMLYGSFEKYFGVGGLKNTSAAIIDGNLIGKDPDGTTPDVPSGEGTGEGTKESPYNVAKALNLIATGANTSAKVYVSGIISDITEISTSFGNATYKISDDGNKTNELIVYRGYSLGGKKFTSQNEIQVGDKVVVYGELVNYMGNTPEFTTGNEIYSLNGKTSNEGGNDNPGGGDDNTGGGDDVQKGDGASKTSPYSVSQAISNQGSHAWVTGYVVGYVNGTSIQTGAVFAIPESLETEILIAETPEETNYTKCIPVQLPAGEIRTNIELSAHKEYYKKQIILYGSLEKYFGVPGLKTVTVAIIEGKQFGTDPK